jgi:hypothetical protein
MPIFWFRCLGIRNPYLILRLDSPFCLNGQSDKLQLYETMIIIPLDVVYLTSEYV